MVFYEQKQYTTELHTHLCEHAPFSPKYWSGKTGPAGPLAPALANLGTILVSMLLVDDVQNMIC